MSTTTTTQVPAVPAAFGADEVRSKLDDAEQLAHVQYLALLIEDLVDEGKVHLVRDLLEATVEGAVTARLPGEVGGILDELAQLGVRVTRSESAALLEETTKELTRCEYELELLVRVEALDGPKAAALAIVEVGKRMPQAFDVLSESKERDDA